MFCENRAVTPLHSVAEHEPGLGAPRSSRQKQGQVQVFESNWCAPFVCPGFDPDVVMSRAVFLPAAFSA